MKFMVSRAIKILVSLLIWLWVSAHAQAKPITLAYNSNALNVTLPIFVRLKHGESIAGISLIDRRRPCYICRDRNVR